MRPPAPDERRRALSGRALAMAASVAALASAFMGAKAGVPRLDDARDYWNAVDSSVRDDPVAHLYGFGEPLWVELQGAVGAGDRYAVIAEGDGQHEIRNYAGYRLLPAIQVSDPIDADVVVFYGVEPPATGCVSLGEDVCIVRRPE
jgi:hypothetical protein